MNQPELGRRILELRQNLGLTQGELADNCHLSLRTVQRIESAEVTPRSHTIRALLSYLDEDYVYFSRDLSQNLPGIGDRKLTRLEQFSKYVLELFNLKTNTMKKLSVLSLITMLMIIGVLHSNETKAQKIEGWLMEGYLDNYVSGLDKKVFKTGGSSAFLEAKKGKGEGFGILKQACRANEYWGKRIKMTAYIKADNVSDWCEIWFHVKKNKKDGPSFSNAHDQAINGSCDWTKYEIVVDVPENSMALEYGVFLDGTGKIWFDNVSFEVLEYLETDPSDKLSLPRKPVNLDFSN